jgi:hypothetical protein
MLPVTMLPVTMLLVTILPVTMLLVPKARGISAPELVRR